MDYVSGASPSRKQEEQFKKIKEKENTNIFARSKIKQILDSPYPIVNCTVLQEPTSEGLRIEIRFVYTVTG
jgi:hypothetical protein